MEDHLLPILPIPGKIAIRSWLIRLRLICSRSAGTVSRHCRTLPLIVSRDTPTVKHRLRAILQSIWNYWMLGWEETRCPVVAGTILSGWAWKRIVVVMAIPRKQDWSAPLAGNGLICN